LTGIPDLFGDPGTGRSFSDERIVPPCARRCQGFFVVFFVGNGHHHGHNLSRRSAAKTEVHQDHEECGVVTTGQRLTATVSQTAEYEVRVGVRVGVPAVAKRLRLAASSSREATPRQASTSRSTSTTSGRGRYPFVPLTLSFLIFRKDFHAASRVSFARVAVRPLRFCRPGRIVRDPSAQNPPPLARILAAAQTILPSTHSGPDRSLFFHVLRSSNA